MEVQINGETRHVPDESNVAQLLDQMGLTGRRIAVEINEQIVPRGHFGARRLRAGDRIEIVHAIGGGQAGRHAAPRPR